MIIHSINPTATFSHSAVWGKVAVGLVPSDNTLCEKVGLMPDTAPPTDLCCDAHNLHKLPQMHKMHKSNAKNIKCKKVSYKSFGQNKDESKT